MPPSLLPQGSRLGVLTVVFEKDTCGICVTNILVISTVFIALTLNNDAALSGLDFGVVIVIRLLSGSIVELPDNHFALAVN